MRSSILRRSAIATLLMMILTTSAAAEPFYKGPLFIGNVIRLYPSPETYEHSSYLSSVILTKTPLAPPVSQQTQVGQEGKLSTNESLQETIERLSLIRGMNVGEKKRKMDWCLSTHRPQGDWHRMIGAVANALKAHNRLVPQGQVYEFGVYNGLSMLSLWRNLKPIYNSLYKKESTATEEEESTFMWGLDSFEGLPKEITSEENRVWQASDYKSKNTVQGDIAAQIQAPVKWVKGWYNESLTDSLPKERGMVPAMYLGIDADLYSSSVTVLDWAFRTGIAVPGTMIGYDDWWVLPCQKGLKGPSPLDGGEGKAHREISEKYDVEFACAAGPCLLPESRAAYVGTVGGCNPYETWGPIFVVQSIGQGRNRTGFEMTYAEMAQWKSSFRLCNFQHSPCKRRRRSAAAAHPRGGRSNGQRSGRSSSSARGGGQH